MRAARALPPARAHQDFAVFLALLAMKLVKRHNQMISEAAVGSRKNGNGRDAVLGVPILIKALYQA